MLAWESRLLWRCCNCQNRGIEQSKFETIIVPDYKSTSDVKILRLVKMAVAFISLHEAL